MKFKANRKGMNELLHSEMVKTEIARRAKRIAAQANANAPVGETGALSASHHVVEDETDRARARVVSELPYAITVEANTGYFSRALDGGVE